MDEIVSFREFADRKRVSAQAISKAVRVGRLRLALTKTTDGRRGLIAAIADREWDSNRSRPTRPDASPAPGASDQVPTMEPDDISIWADRGVVCLAYGPLSDSTIWCTSPATAQLIAERLLAVARTFSA